MLRTAAAPRRSQAIGGAGSAKEGPNTEPPTEPATRPNIPEVTTVETTASTDGSTRGGWLALALFASLGGNLFLGFVAWDIRKRFLAAFRDGQTADHKHSSSGMIAEALDDCTETSS